MLSKLQANKKLVQQHLCHESGKVLLLKDLSNVSRLGIGERGSNDLKKAVTDLMEKHDEFDKNQ